jgi:hypothetical protein
MKQGTGTMVLERSVAATSPAMRAMAMSAPYPGFIHSLIVLRAKKRSICYISMHQCLIALSVDVTLFCLTKGYTEYIFITWHSIR